MENEIEFENEIIALIDHIIRRSTDDQIKLLNIVLRKFINLKDLIKFIEIVVEFDLPNSRAKKRALLSLLEKFKEEWENER